MEVYSAMLLLVLALTSSISIHVHLLFFPLFYFACHFLNVSNPISFATRSLSCSFLRLYLSAHSYSRKCASIILPIIHKITTFRLNTSALAHIGDAYNSLLTTTVDNNFRFLWPELPRLSTLWSSRPRNFIFSLISIRFPFISNSARL